MTRVAAPRSSSVVLVLGVCVAAIAVYAAVFLGQGLGPWSEALAASLVQVLPAALLGWGVWRLVARERRPQGWGWAALEHGAAALLFTTLWLAAVYALVLVLHPQAAPHVKASAGWQLFGGLLVYGAIAATAHAVRTTARLRERELAATRAELQALRAQLDPHFLFNTLHSLSALVRHDPGAAEDALERFGGLMRYVLDANRGAEVVALEDEMGFVRNYLALERLRLGERLRVVEEIDPEALEGALPPLLLQPLVENAVRHGIAPRRQGGTVRLRACCERDTLVLEVADDGPGAAPDACENAAGLGLRAIRRQLEARFPGEAQLTIATRPGEGFTARITLPLRFAIGAGPAMGYTRGHHRKESQR